MIRLTIDNQQITARRGTMILKAGLDNGIFIPHLCHAGQLQQAPASCRLCFVSVEGEPRPVSACTTAIRSGMKVATDSPAARRLQRSALELLLSAHDVDCGHCPANRNCRLQYLARHLGVPLVPRDLKRMLKKQVLDDGHPQLDYYPNRCVLCGRCIHACEREHGRANMAFAKRGIKTVISFYGASENAHADCGACRACVESCPVGALISKTVPPRA